MGTSHDPRIKNPRYRRTLNVVLTIQPLRRRRPNRDMSFFDLPGFPGNQPGKQHVSKHLNAAFCTVTLQGKQHHLYIRKGKVDAFRKILE